ncbi:MAG: type I-E CRISPR-associated protein Cas7/Cse4/CasC, partial [Verrucomicrobiota bacterium]
MKLLELHILQSFPVSCLNRDDLNSPKTATFGGVQRARVSSQCWKRQIRLACNDLDQEKFRGQRSRQFIAEITTRLVANQGEKAEPLSQCMSHYLGKLDPKNPGKVKTIAYYSAGELDRFASVVANLSDADKDKLINALGQVDMSSLVQDDDAEETEGVEEEIEGKPKKKSDKKMTAKAFGKLVNGIIKPALRKEFNGTPIEKDAADIALFGRMVAADHSLTVEGAAMFSHALSTHKVDNEIDFFTAVDDLNPADESGSGHMGTTEFNAATYYRYAAVNLSMLADK